jgi:hypothetical protein
MAFRRALGKQSGQRGLVGGIQAVGIDSYHSSLVA